MEVELQRPVFKIRGASELPPDTIPNVRAAALEVIPHLRQLGEHSGTAVIVGAGPSVVGCLGEIRELACQPTSVVFPINCMHRWLLDHGITPGIQVMFEADADLHTVLGAPCAATTYYVCSACPPTHHCYLRGFHRVLWHHWDQDADYDQVIAQYYPGELMVGGGYSTLFRTINIALLLGFRDLDLFGVDSSFLDDDHQHVGEYPTRPSDDDLATVELSQPVTLEIRKFRTRGALLLQADMLVKFREDNEGQVSMRVHGSGLLPFMYNPQGVEDGARN